MPTSTVTTKGQVTIPKSIRDALGLHPGDRVLFVRHDDGTVAIEPETVDVRSLYGRFKHFATRPVSVDEMNDTIGEAAADRHRDAAGP